MRASRGAVSLTGTLGQGARFTLTFAVASDQRLAMTVHVAAPGASAVLLTAASTRREAVHGFGAMTRWNLKGAVVPIITREQGVGRGEPGVTQAENQLTPAQGGSFNTTCAVVPQYLTSIDRGFFSTNDQYGVFDLSRRDRISSQVWSTTMHAQVLRGRTPKQLIQGNRPQLNVQVYSTPKTARGFAVWARVFRALGPYRHRLEREANATGMPIVRPLWLTWPRLQAVTREFTLGGDLLVAPAFAPGVTRTRVILPPGRWVHVWSGRTYTGRRSVTVSSPLGRPAVFTRPGPLRKLITTAAKGT